MTGIVIAGAGVGGLVGPLVISRLIVAYDWRLSFVILGGVGLLAIILAAQFQKRDPTQMGQLPYGGNEGNQQGLESETNDFSFKEAVPTAQFWLSFMMLLCYAFSFSAILVHIVPHATELGISAVRAANILAAFSGLSILGNYVLGGVGDRIGSRQVFIIGYIIMSAALFGLVPAREMWMLYLCAAVFGFASGGTAAAESPLVARLFGLSSHGLVYGVIHLGFTVGAALGPFVFGYIFDLTGGYQTAFLVSAVIGIVGLILSALLRPTKRLGGRI